MTAQGIRRVTWITAILALVFLAAAGYWFVSYGVLRLRTALADEQTEIFVAMRDRSLQSTRPEEIAGFLEYAVWYYPPGTKQEEGSRLDRIVERCRSLAVADIMNHLRKVTGTDLGQDPEMWLEKYRPDRRTGVGFGDHSVTNAHP